MNDIMIKKLLILVLLLLTRAEYAQTVSLKMTRARQINQLDLKSLDPIFYFKIEDRKNVKGRAVVLYAKNGQLNYAFIDSVGKVEFAYPKETDEESPGFVLDTAKDNLSVSFANKTVNYRVYELPKKIGVEATIGGILYEQIGVLHSKKGSLKDLLSEKLDNLIIR
jgi:hypothetical protein